jgi:DNA topoisomerase-1
LIVEETIKQPPHRYNDATFVSQLEKAGIGRPSTYASIVETILARGYAEVKDVKGIPVKCRLQTHEAGKEVKTTMVEKMVGNERKRLTITELGQAVCSFLYPTSDELLGVKATAEMESLLDDISNGKK